MTEQIPILTSPAESVPERQVVLHPIHAANDASSLSLMQGSYLIGSAVDCDVTLPGNGVEPQHCRIDIGDEGATVVAESVMTWVNDEPIRRQAIQHGDRVTIGPLEYEVQIASDVGTETRRFDDAQHDTAVGPTATSAMQRRPATSLWSRDNTSSDVTQCGAPVATRRDILSAEPRGASRSGLTLEASGLKPAATTRALQKARKVETRFEADPTSAKDRVSERDRRRTHMECLLDDLLNETASAIASRRIDEQNTHDAAAPDDAAEVERLRTGLQRRITALQEDESRVCTQRSELDQAVEALAEQRRDQFEREQRLQARMEHCNELEAALIEREIDVCSEAERLRRRDSKLTRNSQEVEERLAQLEWQLLEHEAALGEWETERLRLEGEVARLQGELADADVDMDQGPSEEQLAAFAEIAESRAELDRQREEFGAKVEQLVKDRRTLREDQEAFDVLRTNLQTRQQELDEEERRRQERLEELEADVRRLEVDHEQVCGERDEIRTTQQQFAEQRSALEEEVAELRSQLDVIREEAESETDEPQLRLAELEADYRTLLDEQSQLKQEHSELQMRQNDLERERVGLHEQINLLHVQCNAALRELELLESRSHEERPMAHAKDDQTPLFAMRRNDTPEVDEYELADDQDDAVEEDLNAAGNIETETALRLRAEMAEMFGIGADVLTSSARRTHQDSAAGDPGINSDGDAATTPDDHAEPPQPAIEHEAASHQPETHLDADDPDSVASYMRNLMARNRGGRDVTEHKTPAVVARQPEPKPAKAATSAPAPESQPSASTPTRTPSCGPSEASASVDSDRRQSTTYASPVKAAADLEPQKPERARSNFELERQHIDSFRELANLSARSAVAKHNSVTLRNTLLIQAIVTGACVAATVVLLTSPLWSAHSYLVWGCLTALLSAVMACKLLQTMNMIRRPGHVRKHGDSGKQPVPVADVATQPGNSCEPEVSVAVDGESAEKARGDGAVAGDVETSAVDVVAADDDLPHKVNSAMPTLAYDEVIPG